MMKSRIGSTSSTLSALLAGVLVLQLSAPAFAQEPGAVSMDREGKPGIWMPSELAHRVLADVEEKRVKETELQVCKARLDVKDERIKALKDANTQALEAARTARASVDQAVRGREQAERANQGWFAGKPLVWTIVGLVLGVAGTGTVVALVHK